MISVNLHTATGARAVEHAANAECRSFSRVVISDAAGNEVNLFLERGRAQAVADAINGALAPVLRAAE